jgi:hypothetical protein
LDLPRLLLTTTVLWPIYSSEYLVCVRPNVVELGCGIVLPGLEVGMMAFIVVEFNEPLIGVMYLVSLQPDPPMASSIVRLLLAVGPPSYRGSA